jgi:hypothetical protein
MFRSNLVHSMALVSAAAVFSLSQSAFGIANQHLNPHSDAAAEISWKNGAGVPDTTNHLHLSLRGGEVITQGGALISSNKGWSADSVWDDRFLRFVDANNDQDTDIGGAFGHGYIDPNFAPRYRFTGAPNNEAKSLVDQALDAWDTAAKAASAGKTTPNGTPVVTSIAMSNDDTNYEFTVAFIEGFQEAHGAFGEWLVSNGQLQAGDPAVPTLAFELTPTNKLEMLTRGVEISNDNGATWVTRVDQVVNWSFDKTPAVVNVDIDYRVDDTMGGWIYYEGDEFDFTQLGLSLVTNFDVLDAGDTIDLYEVDLFTIALHETGHVIGLLHTPGPANIMRADIGLKATLGNTLQTIDADSAYGAALLYSIPAFAIPEPTALVAFVLAGGLFRRRR